NLDGNGQPHAGVKLVAIPVGDVEENFDRGSAVTVRPTVNLFVSRYLDIDGAITRKTMGAYLHEIVVSLRGVKMDSYDWEKTEVVTKYDPEKLRTQGRFLAVLGLTYMDLQ
ncbi:MAG: hypothetical protein GY771_01800, partial [bacterium]|nr:hypothetical protein [bacterium]